MISPQRALERLKEGNTRFYEGNSIHPNRCEETKAALISKQEPFVAVLSCSDSRVPVEIIFDKGLGDIFSVRTAGHVLSPEVVGSLEYAVKHLNVKLVVILGHENCGAVKSALQTYKEDGYSGVSENLQSILNHIYPAFEHVSCDKNDDELLHCAVHSNIQYQVQDLLNKDKYIADKVEKGELMVVGANYSLADGRVKFYD